jgi:toxin-antitoxin system PIN domain toxin
LILCDVNIYIQAFRPDAGDHARCRAWLDAVVNGPSRYGVSPQALSGLLRIVTNPRAFKQPSPLEEALTFCDAVLGGPHCAVVHPGERHWDIFRRLCRDADARANLVPDAWFAALAIEWGCEWITLDRGFARYPGLRWGMV